MFQAMKSKRLLMTCVVLICIPVKLLAHEIDCDSENVEFFSGVLKVTPNGVDDTENIQCALDQAIANRIAIVRLGIGEFFITSVLAENFNGTLEGSSREGTVVTVLDRAVGCSSNDPGRSTAIFKFAEGKPTIRTLTINGYHPCSFPGDFALIHFTGKPIGVGCEESNVVLGVVDRVNLVVPEDAGHFDAHGVVAISEARQRGFLLPEDKPDCGLNLLGTLRVNRCNFEGVFRKGVDLQMQSGSQVDINFSVFRGNITSINVRDANQFLNIQRNEFINSEHEILGGQIWLEVGRGYGETPKKNRMVIHKNSFDLRQSGESFSPAIVVRASDFGGSQKEVIQDLSLVVTVNEFRLENSSAMLAKSVKSGIFTDNKLSGQGAPYPVILGGDISNDDMIAYGEFWSITGNDFNELVNVPGFEHIRLGPFTRGNIVGPAQGAEVDDFTGENIVLGPQ